MFITIPGYSMYLESGGYWLSHEIINQSELINILNEIAGEGFTFSPNVIDDGGLGRYSLPEGEEEMTDDEMLNGDTDSGDTDTGGTDSGDTDTGDTDTGGTDTGGTDTGDTDDGDIDPWDIPAPE